MKYKIGFINHYGHHQTVLIGNVSHIDVREGAYLLYDDADILLYSIKVADITVLGNIDLIEISSE